MLKIAKNQFWEPKIKNGSISTIFSILEHFGVKSSTFWPKRSRPVFHRLAWSHFWSCWAKKWKNVQKCSKRSKSDFWAQKCILGSKERKSAFSAFLRFLTSGAFIWAYYSKVSCVLAEASELLQKFCRVAPLWFFWNYKNMILHKIMIYVKVIKKWHARPWVFFEWEAW